MNRNEVKRVEKQKVWWNSPAGLMEKRKRSERMKTEVNPWRKAVQAIKLGKRDEVKKIAKMKEWWNSTEGLQRRKLLSSQISIRNRNGQASKAAIASWSHSDEEILSRLKKHGKVIGYFKSDKMKDWIPFRSYYELRFMIQLEHDCSVVGYEYEPVRVQLEVGYTIPDFLVHGKTLTDLVEVKSEWCLKVPFVIKKLEAMQSFAQQKGYKFKLVTETELRV